MGGAIDTAPPGETVTRHEDVIGAARALACTAASVYCATYLPDHTAAEHAAVEARYLHQLMQVVHDSTDEIHGDLALLRLRGVDEADVPERLRELAA